MGLKTIWLPNQISLILPKKRLETIIGTIRALELYSQICIRRKGFISLNTIKLLGAVYGNFSYNL